MARLYANENVPLVLVENLRQSGHDVLTVQDSGLANRRLTDPAVLAFARAEGRIVVTFNRRHFIHLHAAQPDHSGIIVCTVDADLVALAGRIHHILEHHGSLNGQLMRITRPAR